MPCEAAPCEALLGTRKAAEVLNVSRLYLVSLLESGAIRFSTLGGHRCVLSSHVEQYRSLRDKKRRQILNDMTLEAHEQGLNWD